MAVPFVFIELMRDDIRSAFENNYIGINNSYDNKKMFIAAIGQYFDSIADPCA